MRQKFGGLDSTDRAFHQMSKLLPLFLGDRGAQVLNFDHTLTDEYHLGYVRNTRHPGVADELGIQSKQPLRLFWITAGGRFPFQQTTLAVEFPYRVDVGDELIATASCRVNLTCKFR